MMGQLRYVFITIALLCFMCCMVSAAPLTQNISYQGMLTNAAGNPLTGTYTVTFNLYEASSGGSTLATDTHSVQASKGEFTTQITANTRFFDGRALWLGIKVGSDPEMTPRQELRPVPYALSLRPGALIKDGRFTTTQEKNPFSWEGIAGVVAMTSTPDSIGVVSETDGPDIIGVYGLTTGLNSPAIMGVSYQDIGVYGVGKEGGYFTTRQGGTSTNDLKAGINLSTKYDYNPGLVIATSGFSSEGINTHTSGDNGYGATFQVGGNNSNGVYAHTIGTDSDGVQVVTSGLDSEGVIAYTSGEAAEAFYGSTIGPGSDGVYSHTSGNNSQGVHGYSEKDIGVGGYSDNYYGVYGSGKTGIYGKGQTGINAESLDGGVAVIATSSGGGTGLVATAGPDPYARGVWAHASNQGTAVVAQIDSGTGTGILAIGGPQGGPAAEFLGNVQIKRKTSPWPLIMELGEGLDYSEGFNISNRDSITPGSVLIISLDNPGTLTLSIEPYDRKVAGIVSGAKGLGSAVRVGGDQFDSNIALAGRVYCNVDATYGAVEPGDLLTTSSTPGYAMVVQDYSRAQGATIGKAMEGLEQGQKGQILVLVTLQ